MLSSPFASEASTDWISSKILSKLSVIHQLVNKMNIKVRFFDIPSNFFSDMSYFIGKNSVDSEILSKSKYTSKMSLLNMVDKQFLMFNGNPM